MEKIALDLTIDSIMNQANNVFSNLFNGAMDMVNKITESIGSVTSGL